MRSLRIKMPGKPRSMQPLTVLQERFGHASFRGQQVDAITRILNGSHALVIMPTCMGKSLCYQIPALIFADQDLNSDAGDATPRGLTLVISPLIALMKDQVDSLQRRGISAAYINSSLTRSERESRYAKALTLMGMRSGIPTSRLVTVNGIIRGGVSGVNRARGSGSIQSMIYGQNFSCSRLYEKKS